MTGLAVSVLAMVLQVTTAKGQFDLVPLSMSLSLIFGLPALRNVQPGVPPWERSATMSLLLGRN
jgi:hypothetical protein